MSTARVSFPRVAGIGGLIVFVGLASVSAPTLAVVPVSQPPITAVDGTMPPSSLPPGPATSTAAPTLPASTSTTPASTGVSNTIPVSGVIGVNDPVTTVPGQPTLPPIQAGSGPVSPPTTAALTSTTLGVPTSRDPSSTVSPSKPAAGSRTPEELRSAVMAALQLSTAKSKSALVVLEGTGTIVEVDADIARTPASTQKVYVAGAMLAKLGGEHRYSTEVRSTTILDSGAVDELVLRASGDPSFSSGQLAALADGVVKAGVRTTTGLVLDDTRFDNLTRLEIWKRSFTPGEVGVLSSFTIDGNHRGDAETSSDPGMANLKRFRAALTARGVTVGPGSRRGQLRDGGPVIAAVQSAPLRDLVRTMLKKSDNTYAEMFTKELGARSGNGSTSGGVAAISAYMVQLGVGAPVSQVDGSGLSSSNRSTPRQQVDFLRRTSSMAYAADFIDGLPVACVDGTMRNRLCQTSGARRVQAKTGGLDFVVGLAGYGETSSGKRVTFSFLLNDVRSSSSARASIDKALAAISASTV